MYMHVHVYYIMCASKISTWTPQNSSYHVPFVCYIGKFSMPVVTAVHAPMYPNLVSNPLIPWLHVQTQAPIVAKYES